MNRIKLRKPNILEYKAFIFDLDGTLYYQKPFRIKMLMTLIKYVILHPAAIKDLFVIKRYRQVREHWDEYEKEYMFDKGLGLDEKQYAAVAAKTGTTPERVKNAVRFFMHEMPLNLLLPYRDEILKSLIDIVKEKKKTIVIYSDYPVEAKLACLGITADACYTSGDACIGCMKPDPKGLKVILDTLGCDSVDAVMIGDRYEKDGLAAQRNNVDYVIVDGSKKEREKLRDMWA